MSKLEKWKPVPGFDWLYEVSSLGNVRGIAASTQKKILKKAKDRDGYSVVHLCRLGRYKSLRVGRLVALAFLGQPPADRLEVNHINHIRDDDRLCNLEWTSRRENMKQALARRGGKWPWDWQELGPKSKDVSR
jgi:NUMOD4 motif/HNH endonuclease